LLAMIAPFSSLRFRALYICAAPCQSIKGL
jgi:hypothetical protein